MSLLPVEPRRVGNPHGTPSQLLHDPEARRRRGEEKQTAVLRFLREEIYSTSAILGRVMGVASRPAVQKTLQRMEEEELIRSVEISFAAGKRLLWGITTHGQATAFNPRKGEPLVTKVIEPWSISDARLHHTLTLQTVRLDGQAAHWTGWRSCDRGVEVRGKGGKQRHRADAIVINPAGEVVALELELTFKSIHRYARQVLPSHLRQIVVDRQYQQVLWVCPEAGDAERMRSLLHRAFEQVDNDTRSRWDIWAKETGKTNLFQVGSMEDWTTVWQGKKEDRAKNLYTYLWQRLRDAAADGKDLEARAVEEKRWLPESDHALVGQTLESYQRALAAKRQQREAELRREQEERERQAREASERYAAEVAAREEAERRANSLAGKLGKLIGK